MKAFSYIILSLLSPIYLYTQSGNVGIGVENPQARLHVDSTVLFTGTINYASSASLPVTGAGTRLIWYPEKSAFRVGTVTGTEWDFINIGIYSAAIGYDATASGNSSIAIGYGTTASGISSTAMGQFSTASGDRSTALGYNTSAAGIYSTTFGSGTYASGNRSTALGYNTSATGEYATAMGSSTIASGFRSTALGHGTNASGENATALGSFTKANGYASTVVGIFNDTIVNAETTYNLNTPLFIVGNGNSENSRSNALLVRKDGHVGIGTDHPDAQLHVYGNENDGTNTTLRVSSGVQHLLMDGNEIDAIKDDLYLQNNTLKNLILVNGGGNIGINTISPGVKLDINDPGDDTYENLMVRLKSTVSKNPIIGFSDQDGGSFVDMSIGMDGRFGTRSINIYNGAIDPKFSVLQNGRVGIGTDGPDRDVTIYDAERNGSSFMNIKDATREVLIGVNSSGGSLRTMTDHDLSFWTNNARRVDIDRNGFVGIGTSSPTALLEVNAFTVKKVSGGSWSSTSDRRLKKEIHPFKDGLAEILKIYPVKYHYNLKSGYDTSIEHIGVIAQELKEVTPYMVSSFIQNGEEYLQVDNSAMTYMLINAIQELSRENDLLKKELENSNIKAREMDERILKLEKEIYANKGANKIN